MSQEIPILADGLPDLDPNEEDLPEDLILTAMGAFDGFHLRGVPIDDIHNICLDRSTWRSVRARAIRGTKVLSTVGQELSARSLVDDIRATVSDGSIERFGTRDVVPAHVPKRRSWIDLFYKAARRHVSSGVELRFQRHPGALETARRQLRADQWEECAEIWQRIDGLVVVLETARKGRRIATPSGRVYLDQLTSMTPSVDVMESWDAIGWSDEWCDEFIRMDGALIVRGESLRQALRTFGLPECGVAEAVRRAEAAGWAPGAGFYDDWPLDFDYPAFWWDFRLENLAKRWLDRKGYTFPGRAYAEFVGAHPSDWPEDDSCLWKRLAV